MKKRCEVEVFSRVTGFYRPVQSWNKGKTAEFKDRKRFNVEYESEPIENADSRVTESVTG
jgi:ribonucleoside-triphosphate reductase